MLPNFTELKILIYTTTLSGRLFDSFYTCLGTFRQRKPIFNNRNLSSKNMEFRCKFHGLKTNFFFKMAALVYRCYLLVIACFEIHSVLESHQSNEAQISIVGKNSISKRSFIKLIKQPIWTKSRIKHILFQE